MAKIPANRKGIHSVSRQGKLDPAARLYKSTLPGVKTDKAKCLVDEQAEAMRAS